MEVPFNMLTLLLPEAAKVKFTPKFEISSCKVLKKIVLPESNAKKVSFEWSHHRTSFVRRLENENRRTTVRRSPTLIVNDGNFHGKISLGATHYPVQGLSSF